MPFNNLLEAFHPQGIPWPCSHFYNAISRSRGFQSHYILVAKDISSFWSEGRVLDLGTGPGWLLIEIHRLCPALHLTGVDISPAMVRRARMNMSHARLSHLIEVRTGAAGLLPFPDCYFDGVVSTGSIHHWKDPVGGLDDIYRVLKPGGLALIYDLVRDTPRHILREMIHTFGRLRVTLLWLHSFEEPFYTKGSLLALAGSTLFVKGKARFVGALCCLSLRKPPKP